uniref:Uncharacterized protein n=1 Tax=Aegilops tauschii subsp. strangulata TaxID=200361 RepID=A0A453A6L8_AEGTS
CHILRYKNSLPWPVTALQRHSLGPLGSGVRSGSPSPPPRPRQPPLLPPPPGPFLYVGRIELLKYQLISYIMQKIRDHMVETYLNICGFATLYSCGVPVSVVQGQRQESAKSDNENKANDGEPSSAETEQSNGKANIGDTLMDESQTSNSFKY